MINNLQELDLSAAKTAIEEEIKRILSEELLPDYRELQEIMIYHLGWDIPSNAGRSGGKRLRPLFLLLCAQAAGGNWKASLPAAAAVELIHNFTLIHDDIQDNSPLRHGRDSVWVRWNMPLAINAGDAMFSLANLALLRLAPPLPPEVVVQAQKMMLETCVKLTFGQHLDISNEARDEIEIADYLTMIEGKTAALIGTSMGIGALTAGKDEETILLANRLGLTIGMAFQVIDDILGIWGESVKTGKSTTGDLMSRKLSLPILFGIKEDKNFAKRWRQGSFEAEEIPSLAEMLADEGAKEYSEKIAAKYTGQAVEVFDQLGFDNPAGRQLRDLCQSLITRKY